MTLAVIFKLKKAPEPLVIAIAGIVGVIVHRALGIAIAVPQ